MDYKKDNYACSYTEIAERLNLTRNQVIAIERRAMKKIKVIVNKTNKLKDYAYAGTIRTASRFTSGHSAGVDSDS